MAWHGLFLGHLTHDGFEWSWKPRERVAPVLVRESAPGKLPPFIESLLPEGWLSKVLQESDPRHALRGTRRFMSNVSVAPSRAELADLPEDILLSPLEAFSDAGRFTGHYRGPRCQDRFSVTLAKTAVGHELQTAVAIKSPNDTYIGTVNWVEGCRRG